VKQWSTLKQDLISTISRHLYVKYFQMYFIKTNVSLPQAYTVSLRNIQSPSGTYSLPRKLYVPEGDCMCLRETVCAWGTPSGTYSLPQAHTVSLRHIQSPSDTYNLITFSLSCLCPLVYLLPKTFRLFSFQIFWLWVYTMKVIPNMPCIVRTKLYL
jgi:hypothetical protein